MMVANFSLQAPAADIRTLQKGGPLPGGVLILPDVVSEVSGTADVV